VPSDQGEAFDPDGPWRLHPQAALRDESFGALVYHYGNRRLTFLKSPVLTELVRSLDRYPSAAAAVAGIVPEDQRPRHLAALGRLASSEIIARAEPRSSHAA